MMVGGEVTEGAGGDGDDHWVSGQSRETMDMIRTASSQPPRSLAVEKKIVYCIVYLDNGIFHMP